MEKLCRRILLSNSAQIIVENIEKPGVVAVQQLPGILCVFQISGFGYGGAVVHCHISGMGTVSDVVRKGLHFRQKGGMPTGHEIRVILLPGAAFIHDLEQVPGAHGGNPQGAPGADDLRFRVAAGGVGTVGEQKAHGAVFTLDHGGSVVGVVQLPVKDSCQFFWKRFASDSKFFSSKCQ